MGDKPIRNQLLEVLAGKCAQKPDNGQIMIQHIEVPQVERKDYVTCIDTEDFLLESHTVKEQLTFASRMRHHEHQEGIYKAEDLMENFNLEDKAVKDLSEHEKRCLTIGQAMICNKGVLALQDPLKG